MAVERTFSIIKPDATRRNLTGKINARFEDKGLRIVAQKRIRMTRMQAEQFYGVHKARPFFNDLCTFMTSGPVVVQVLEGEGAVAKNRDIMGATNPANAAAGTIRKDFAEIDRGQLRARLQFAGECRDRDRLLLRRIRDRRLATGGEEAKGSRRLWRPPNSQLPSSRPRAAGPSGETFARR